MARTDSDTLNYRGQLFLIGQNRTPFSSMIAARNPGARAKAFTFPVAQPWSLNAASQNVQSETTSAAAGTPSTYTRAQDTNVCQIMKYDAATTFKKQSTAGSISGINTNDTQPVLDELGFQKKGALGQMAIDVEYSFLNGTYVAESAVTDNVATRGIVTATTTNTVAAGGATLDKDLFDQIIKEMADTGSPFVEPVVFVNSFQKQKLTQAYDYVPPDRNIGGSNIMQIETDFAIVKVVYAPFMETDELLVAELDVCRPVFVPVTAMYTPAGQLQFMTDTTNGGDVIWVPTATTAAASGGFFYTQIGLDYGPEEYHGTITGLATS
jgi:hypothetical protein